MKLRFKRTSILGFQNYNTPTATSIYNYYKLQIVHTYYSRHDKKYKRNSGSRNHRQRTLQNWLYAQKTQKHFKHILFECTEHSCDKDLIYEKNAAQYGSLVEYVNRAVCEQLVHLPVVTGRLMCFLQGKQYLLSSLPGLPKVLEKEDFPPQCPQSQKQHGLQFEMERNGQVTENTRLIVLS